MTVAPFLVIAATGGMLSLLVRDRRSWSTAVAAAGLLAMIAAAAAMDPAATARIGGVDLAGSAWLRLYALLGSLVGLILVTIDVAAMHEPDVPGTIVLGLGAAVIAIAITDPGVAVAAATAGGLAAVLVAAPVGAAARAAVVGVRELRALAVAGALAIGATAWLARPLGDLTLAPALFGFAYLAFAVAVAIRLGAIPFHLWAARAADAAPGVALPLLLAWGPAAFAAVALAWIDRSVAPLALPLAGEQGVIAAIGAISVVLGLVAAAVQDDLEHVVGYTIIADAGFVVLALAAFDPGVWEPSRTWLLVFVVCRSAFAAWAVAINGAYGTRRLSELGGWARRSPALTAALALVAGAAVGWPALASWQARASLVHLALPDVAAVAVMAAPVAGLAIYGRILRVGLRPPSPAVRDGVGERPGWPAPWPGRPMVGTSATERVMERSSHAIGGLLDVLWQLPAAGRRNRTGIASIAVLVLAGLAAAVSAGGLGVPEAARAAPRGGEVGPGGAPTPSGPTPSAPAPGESDQLLPSDAQPTPTFTFEPVGGSPSDSPPTAPSGSPRG